MIEQIKEFLLNVIAGILAAPVLLLYLVVCVCAVVFRAIELFVSDFKELFVVALITLLIIDGAHYSTGVSIAIVVIFVLLCLVWGDDGSDEQF